MADLVCSAKSGSDWSQNKLLVYHISVKTIKPNEFFIFGSNPSLDHLDQVILTTSAGADNADLSESAIQYLGYLDLATNHCQWKGIFELRTYLEYF